MRGVPRVPNETFDLDLDVEGPSARCFCLRLRNGHCITITSRLSSHAVAMLCCLRPLWMPNIPSKRPNSLVPTSIRFMANTLSVELCDEIFSQVDLRTDLINVACACRSFASLLLPRHTEYRIIRMARPLPWIWVHLVKRPDLARNIREIYFCPSSSDFVERLPTSLVQEVDDSQHTVHGLAAARTMAAALARMTHLRIISCGITGKSMVSTRYQHVILQPMTKLSTLESLTLWFDTKFGDWSRLPTEGSRLVDLKPFLSV